MVKIKGSIDLTTLILFIGPMLLISIVAGLFLTKGSVESTLGAEVRSSEDKFRAHMTTNAFLNKSIRRNISLYSYQNESTQDEWREKILKRTRVVMGPQGTSWSFNATGITGLGKSIGGGAKRYSSVYLASPSREPEKVVIGVGGV